MARITPIRMGNARGPSESKISAASIYVAPAMNASASRNAMPPNRRSDIT
jgi:hypothetical protein